MAGLSSDFKLLIDIDGTLDASPLSFDKDSQHEKTHQRVPVSLCARSITSNACKALESCSLTCLDMRFNKNKNIVALPIKELCTIASLQEIRCWDCSSMCNSPLLQPFNDLRTYLEKGAVNAAILRELGVWALTPVHSFCINQLETDLEAPFLIEDYKSALATLTSLPTPTRQRFETQVQKLTANILLVSDLGRAEDFALLIRDNGTLDASPQWECKEVTGCIPQNLCAKFVSAHAARQLKSTRIVCLDLKNNRNLVTLPCKLCDIDSLQELILTGCSSLNEKGGIDLTTLVGKETMKGLQMSFVNELEMNLEGPMQRGEYQSALQIFKSNLKSLGYRIRERFKAKFEKIQANILLTSTTVKAEDFAMLFESGGTLDASPQCDEETGRIAHGLCARFISVHAARALQSTGIACLNLTHNQYLNNLPVKELCNIESLMELRCEGCCSLTTIGTTDLTTLDGIEAVKALPAWGFELALLKHIQRKDYQMALEILKSDHELIPSGTRFIEMIQKIEANILLASIAGNSSLSDFQQLIMRQSCRHINHSREAPTACLDASPACGDRQIHDFLCARFMSEYAASNLNGIVSLDLSHNPHLAKLPVKELCGIDTLQELSCRGCSALIVKGGIDLTSLDGKETIKVLPVYGIEVALLELIQRREYEAALEMLIDTMKSLAPQTLERYKTKLDKARANMLLASNTVCAQDFIPLIRDGTLDACPVSEDDTKQMPYGLCARLITPHAIQVLDSCKMQCLDIRSNPHIFKVPAEVLCKSSIRMLECAGCPLLDSPPAEVADRGGTESMRFLRECFTDGAMNQSLALFLIGDGEAGKTSVMRAIMNEEGSPPDVSPAIAKDTRTVGMDMIKWPTKDRQGHPFTFEIKDVGGQKVYMKLYEFFVLNRGIYLYLWRADRDIQSIIKSITQWLNLLQSCVPGVSVVPVCTHIDCVSPTDLELKYKGVKKGFHD